MPRPYIPTAGGAPSRVRRGNPARLSGSGTGGSSRPAFCSRSRLSSVSQPCAGRRREGGDIGASGGARSRSTNLVSSAALSVSPAEYFRPAAAARYRHRCRCRPGPPTRRPATARTARRGRPVRRPESHRSGTARPVRPRTAAVGPRCSAADRGEWAGQAEPFRPWWPGWPRTPRSRYPTGPDTRRSHRPRHHIDPVVIQTPPPHPHLGAVTEQIGQRTELIGRRQRQTAGGLDETGERQIGAGQGGGAQIGSRPVIIRRRPGGHQRGQREQHRHHGDDEAPAPCGTVPSSHAAKGTERPARTMAQ